MTIIVQGAGLGFVFIPLQVLAFATLAPQLRTDGASLFSLFRNIGAAIGVSVTSSMLAHNTQMLHAEIGASVTPFNRALQTGGAVQHMLDPATQHGAAMLDQMINQQAQIIAYIDDYKMMIFTTLPSLLLLLLMRRPRRTLARAGGDPRRDGVTRPWCRARRGVAKPCYSRSRKSRLRAQRTMVMACEACPGIGRGRRLFVRSLNEIASSLRSSQWQTFVVPVRAMTEGLRSQESAIMRPGLTGSACWPERLLRCGCAHSAGGRLPPGEFSRYPDPTPEFGQCPSSSVPAPAIAAPGPGGR